MLTLYVWWLDQQIALTEEVLKMWDTNLNKDKDWSETRVQIHLILVHLRRMKEILS
jgi:hypothetical protein